MQITLTHRHLVIAAVLAVPVGLLATQAANTPAKAPAAKPARATVAAPADPMLARFAKLSPANISDAMDQVANQRGFLDHDVRPMVAGSFVGRAATSLVRAVPADQSTPATAAKHSVEMIDAQSIVVASVSTHQEGQEASIFKAVFPHSLSLAALVGILVMLYAYVWPWVIPTGHHP